MLDSQIVLIVVIKRPITTEMIAQIRSNIDELMIKLPTMPFNLNGTNKC